MIVTIATIGLSAVATWAIWFGFDNLRILRGTVLWEFRYLVFMLATFAGLSALEWGVDRLKRRFGDRHTDPPDA